MTQKHIYTQEVADTLTLIHTKEKADTQTLDESGTQRLVRRKRKWHNAEHKERPVVPLVQQQVWYTGTLDGNGTQELGSRKGQYTYTNCTQQTRAHTNTYTWTHIDIYTCTHTHIRMDTHTHQTHLRIMAVVLAPALAGGGARWTELLFCRLGLSEAFFVSEVGEVDAVISGSLALFAISFKL